MTVGIPTAAAAETWEMPSLEGMNLEDAQSLYEETVGADGPWLDIINKAPAAAGGINAPVMWEVCEQAPSDGATIAAKSYTAVAVNRPGKC
ncbi:MAG: hypothetical protein ACSLFA_04145 [Mycobacterium sp.]